MAGAPYFVWMTAAAPVWSCSRWALWELRRKISVIFNSCNQRYETYLTNDLDGRWSNSFVTKNLHPVWGRGILGASDLTRTGDLLITSEMHYRLCYTSIPGYYNGFLTGCQLIFRRRKIALILQAVSIFLVDIFCCV